MQFAKAPDKPDTLPQSEQGSSSVTPEVQPPDVVVTPPNHTPSQPVETLPPQTDLPEQKLQSDPVKPEAPENPKTADGTDRTPSSDKDHDFTPESKPQGGGGLPGFDNVPNAGANQGERLDNMYENGNKIGDMD